MSKKRLQEGISSQSERIRTRKDYYLIYLTDGDFHATVNGISFFMKRGDYLCIPPNTTYSYTSQEKSKIKYFWLHFTGCEVEKALALSGISPLNVNKNYDLITSSEMYEELFAEFRARGDGFEYRVEVILRAILLRHGRQSRCPSGATRALDKSVKYIHEHISEELTISALAAREFMSEGYYRRLFKSTYGMSPTEYIIKQRINLASYLLSEADASIEEIAADIGLYDRLYFQRFFKKHTGYTPAVFRAINSKKV